MNWTLSPNIDIGSDRISRADAARQRRTASDILRRLNRQPGVILADEVGMGKTYVALAVAVSVVEATDGERPVVVMVPPSVGEKWPREWDVFRELCLKDGSTWIRATSRAIVRPAPFFKLLDDPPRTRNHIIFLTHGALTNALGDPFTRLALIRRALGRKSLVAQRRSFPRWADRLLPGTYHFKNQHLVEALLEQNPRYWRSTLRRALVDPGDDPVPDALLRVLPRVDIAPLVEALADLPLANGAERRAAPGWRTYGTPAGRSGGLATVHARDGDRAPAPHSRRGPSPEEPRNALRESLRLAGSKGGRRSLARAVRERL